MLEKISFPQMLKQWKIPPKPKKRKVYLLWVKKFIPNKEWNSYYSYNSSYCFLKKEEKGIWVAFSIVNPENENGQLLYPIGIFPKDCLPLSDEKALQVDSQRRVCNVRPFVCEVVNS